MTRKTPADLSAAPLAPRLAMAWAAGFYALWTLLLAWPALGGRFVVSHVSDMHSAYAYRVFAAQWTKTLGAIPEWNPYILGGIPFISGSGFGDILYPMFLVRMAMPVDAAMNLAFALHLFLAGLFAYGFLRAWGLGFIPSLIGGAAYMLSGQVASLVSPGHDGKMYVSALTPLLLWMIVRAVRDGRIWALGVIGLTTGLMVLSPHYQLMYYSGVLAAAFTIYVALQKSEGPLERPVALRRVALAGGAALLGMGIGAIQFVPFFEYIEYSPRGGGGRGWEYAISFSMPPEELINAYLGQFSGIVERYWGRNPLKFHSDYLGASVLVLAGAAFGYGARRSFVRFWIAIGIWALLVAFGGHTPFYYLWYRMPMMSVVRAPGMIFFIVSLSVAVLAAVGTERFFAEPLRRRYLLGWGIAAVVIAVLATLGFFGAIARAFAPPQNAPLIDQNRPDLVLDAWRALLFVGATIGVLWLLGTRKLGALQAGLVLAAVAALDLWSIARHYWRFSPGASELYAADDAVRYLQQQKEPGRVIAFSALQLTGQPRGARNPFLEGDALMIYGIRTATGHQGNEIQRWVELAGEKSPNVNPQRLLDPQFHRLTNTQYLMTDIEFPDNEALTKRIGPVQSAVGTPVFVYEFPQRNPPAFVAPVIVEAPPEAILRTVLDPRFDPRQAALFDSSAEITSVQVTTLPAPSPITPRVTELIPGRITVELDQPAPAGSALVVSENYYPGWRAVVDGRPAPTGRANYTFVGVALPEGARRVELTFHEPRYRTGATITLVALAASMALIALGAVADARRRRG